MSVSVNVVSGVWWKAALVRAVRTALVIAVPYFGTSVVSHVNYLSIGSAAGLGFVLSLVTSLAGIAEVSGGKIPFGFALLERVVKTVAQGLVAGIGNAVLFQDVHWVLILQNAAVAGVGSLLLGVLAELPATSSPLVPVVKAVAKAPVKKTVKPVVKPAAKVVPVVPVKAVETPAASAAPVTAAPEAAVAKAPTAASK